MWPALVFCYRNVLQNSLLYIEMLLTFTVIYAEITVEAMSETVLNDEELKKAILDYVETHRDQTPILLAKVGAHVTRSEGIKLPQKFKLKHFIAQHLKGEIDLIESHTDKTYCAVTISTQPMTLDSDKAIFVSSGPHTRSEEDTLYDILLRNLSPSELKYVSIPLNILSKRIK